jgi:hypothetical protein
MSKNSIEDVVERRGALLVELFLEELEPEFLVHSTSEFAYDFLVGFTNRGGGINTFAVQVKSLEGPVDESIPLNQNAYQQLTHSNIPVLLFVADVKQNRLFYAWLRGEDAAEGPTAKTIRVSVAEVDDRARRELRKQLAA